MITPVLKISDIKKDPNIMLGFDHAFICKRSSVVAHVVSSERMDKLLIAEKMLERIKQDNESQSQLLDMPF